MSAVRHQSSYNGIIFNRVYGGTDPDNPASLVDAYRESDYRLEVFDDSMVSVRDYMEPRQMMEGAEPNQMFEVVRMLRGQGRILGSSYADLEDKVWALRAAFGAAAVRMASTWEVVAKLPDEPWGVLPFDFLRDTNGGQQGLRYYARPLTGRPALVVGMKGGRVRPFEFQLVCPDPRAYKRFFSGTWQWWLGTAIAGTVAYAGNVPTYPQIALVMSGDGGATVVIRNTTTSQQVTLNLSSCGAGTFWLMTEAGEIVRASDRANRYSFKKVATEFLASLFLQPGDNVFTISSTTGMASATVYYKDALA
jgi:hypothetical protein